MAELSLRVDMAGFLVEFPSISRGSACPMESSSAESWPYAFTTQPARKCPTFVAYLTIFARLSFVAI